MVKDKNMWNQLRQLLKENFPNDSDKELERKFNSLKNYDKSWNSKTIVLYAPEFRGAVLRVGIKCEETIEKQYFKTYAEKELLEVLDADFISD